MKVTLAKHAGFCFGVKRALEMVLAAREHAAGPLYTLGPLIHNPQVVARLEGQGITPIASPAEAASGGTLVIPSHGCAPKVVESVQQRGLVLLDATCPFVANAQAYTRQLAEEGYEVVILGDEGHPEVRGLLGCAGGKARLFADDESLNARRVGLVSQTTQTPARLEQAAGRLSTAARELRVFNTICAATSQRQAGALELAGQVGMMVVVGGRNSANTARLCEICSGVVTTHHVEVASELRPEWFSGVSSCGVTAGASTPDWIIEEVMAALRTMPAA